LLTLPGIGGLCAIVPSLLANTRSIAAAPFATGDWVAGLAALLCSMAPLYKHIVAASYQLALFRDALAIARCAHVPLPSPASTPLPSGLRFWRFLSAAATPGLQLCC
jgi:hypothetical protein